MLDRLPMSLDTLRNTKLGKIVVRLGKEASTSGELIRSLSHTFEIREKNMCYLEYNLPEGHAVRCFACTQRHKVDVSNFLSCYSSNAAIKDMASNLERKWRMILNSQNTKESEIESVEGMLHFKSLRKSSLI